ncbi:MAG: hypothetical protein E6Q83_06660 [Thiothrix sp.]|nr:MAG: hypothetical protein E6Q83_06660 [Thiothrix sp.]
MRKFLAYIVEAKLAGELDLLTQPAIAVNALGQSHDFANLDNPLVRVHAGRLRKQLEEYYATEGYFNTLRISLPIGSYQPSFIDNGHHYPDLYNNQNSSISLGPSLICIPRNFTSENNNWAFIACLVRDYVTALSRFSFCQVLFIDEIAAQQANWPADLTAQHHADFGFFFDLYRDKLGFCLKLSLVHSVTTEVAWADSISLGHYYPDTAQTQHLFKRLANDTLSSERGVAHDYWTRYLVSLGKPIPSQYQLLIKMRYFAWNICADNFKAYIDTCEERLKLFPYDVTALICYADCCRIEYLLKYGFIHQLPDRLQEIVARLQQIAPDNAYTQVYLSFAYMLNDDHALALQTLEKAQQLNSLDTQLNVLTGLLYMALDHWELGARYVRDSINISIISPDWYHIPLCIYEYRAGNYRAAIQAAKHVKFKHLWGPMLRSALYNCTNASEKSSLEYQKLLEEHPDLETRRKTLTLGFTHKSHAVINRIWTHLPNK